jgi:hypothetical protein
MLEGVGDTLAVGLSSAEPLAARSPWAFLRLSRGKSRQRMAPMTEIALGLVKAESFQVPALIADIGPEATKRYVEFFTVPIRNKNTRIAYYHAIGQFLGWCQSADFRGLEDI